MLPFGYSTQHYPAMRDLPQWAADLKIGNRLDNIGWYHTETEAHAACRAHYAAELRRLASKAHWSIATEYADLLGNL